MSHQIEIEQLLEAGAHFGHLTRRWNPKMSKYIFDERNGIHILDLRKTQVLVDIARNALHEIASQNKIILFVGTKTAAKDVIQKEAERCRMNYVSERWLGGMLTNFTTIRKSIKRLMAIDKMEVDGTFEKITKKERLLLSRERERLRKVFGGIEEMTRLPGALFVVDIKKEHIAVKEARILGIPVFALVDTNCDPEQIDFPIPANDDSIRTVELITKVLADAILEGNQLSRIRTAEMAADSDRQIKETDSMTEEQAKVHRRMRERKTKQIGGQPRFSKGRPNNQSSDEPNAESHEETAPPSEE